MAALVDDLVRRERFAGEHVTATKEDVTTWNRKVVTTAIQLAKVCHQVFAAFTGDRALDPLAELRSEVGSPDFDSVCSRSLVDTLREFRNELLTPSSPRGPVTEACNPGGTCSAAELFASLAWEGARNAANHWAPAFVKVVAERTLQALPPDSLPLNRRPDSRPDGIVLVKTDPERVREGPAEAPREPSKRVARSRRQRRPVHNGVLKRPKDPFAAPLTVSESSRPNRTSRKLGTPLSIVLALFVFVLVSRPGLRGGPRPADAAAVQMQSDQPDEPLDEARGNPVPEQGAPDEALGGPDEPERRLKEDSSGSPDLAPRPVPIACRPFAATAVPKHDVYERLRPNASGASEHPLYVILPGYSGNLFAGPELEGLASYIPDDAQVVRFKLPNNYENEFLAGGSAYEALQGLAEGRDLVVIGYSTGAAATMLWLREAERLGALRADRLAVLFVAPAFRLRSFWDAFAFGVRDAKLGEHFEGGFEVLTKYPSLLERVSVLYSQNDRFVYTKKILRSSRNEERFRFTKLVNQLNPARVIELDRIPGAMKHIGIANHPRCVNEALRLAKRLMDLQPSACRSGAGALTAAAP